MKLPKIRLGKLRRGNQVGNPVVRQHGTDCGVLCGHHLPQASGAVPLLRREEHHQGNHGKKLILPIETGQELSPVPSSVILLLPMVSGCLLHLPCVLQRIVEQEKDGEPCRPCVGQEPARQADGTAEQDLRFVLANTIQKVTEDLERMSFNTAIARLMELVNTMYRYLDAKGEKNISLLAYAAEVLSLLMAPFAPHFAEELHAALGGPKDFVIQEPWPSYNKEDLEKLLNEIQRSFDHIEKNFREDFRLNREESRLVAKDNREELAHSMNEFRESFRTWYRFF